VMRFSGRSEDSGAGDGGDPDIVRPVTSAVPSVL
jgi:hypothetical protein